jgi:hypothetical protein
MPENENHNENIGNTEPKTETKLEKLEREQMTRRAALRKIGYTSALATFAMFGVDDVVRLVGQKMQHQARNNQVAEVVAKELRSAGVAMANTKSNGPCAGCCSAPDNPDGSSTSICQDCCDNAIKDHNPEPTSPWTQCYAACVATYG